MIDKGMGKIIPSLTFSEFHFTNKRRNEESFKMCENWTASDWICAITGEIGEAANFIKKRNRGEDIETEKIAKELADVVIYIDLLATKLDINLEKAVRNKFNEVSDRVGSNIKL